MHILNLTGKVTLSADDVIEPGTYVVEDCFGAQLLVMGGGGTMRPLEEKRVPNFNSPDGELYIGSVTVDEVDRPVGDSNRTCTSILIGRTGGLGDLTLLTPVLREIKRRWPSVKVAVASIRELQQSIQNLPFIDELLQYPVTLEKAQSYDGWIWLEGAVEKGEDPKTLHSVDCVAKFIGLPLPEGTDKLQSYVVTPQERSWVQWAWPKIPGIRRICIQVKASALCRTYPYAKTKEVMAMLLKDNWEVFLLGGPGDIKEPEKPIPGVRVIADGVSFRQRAALVESSDCFLGPDSSLLHVAGALGVPAVGLYGPFQWQLRTAYCPTTRTLSRKDDYKCAPCHHHATPMQSFPENCPTAAKGYCGAIADIEPKKIVATIEEIAHKLTGGNVVDFPNGKA